MEFLCHTAAWFPARVRIAGVRLAPPTLGHWRLLECAGSPFALGGPATPAATALALAVLSRPWRKARRMLASEWRRAYALASVRPSPADAADLRDWLAECWNGPERYVRDGEGRPSEEAAPPCCPVAVRIACAAVRDRLCEALSRPAASVWDAPVPELLLLRAAFDENAGAEYESPGDAALVGEPHAAPVVPGALVDRPGDVGVPPGEPAVEERQERRAEEHGQPAQELCVVADP